MIRIRKPRRVPEILSTTGKKKTREMCSRYDESPEEYHNGSKRFTFDSKIYGHASVKEILIDAQHGKCCYCEQHVGEDGDVEHFRPKGQVRQDKGSPIEKPGYFWLAYEWTNLLLSCSACNQRMKGDLFPLQNPKSRAVSPRHPIAREKLLFINPATTDPAKHITFLDWKAIPLNGSPSGKKTADLLLNRKQLKVKRERWLKDLRSIRDIAFQAAHQGNLVIYQEATARLEEYTHDDAEFAALSRVALETDFFHRS